MRSQQIVGLSNWVITYLGFALLYTPLLLVIFYSFIDGTKDHLSFSIESYVQLLNNSKLVNSLKLSLFVGASSATLSTAIGTIGAIGMQRSRFWGQGLLDALARAPFMLPELIFGIALLLWFVVLKLKLGFASLIIAHTTFTIAYVVMVINSRLKSLDPVWEAAAQDLGATPLQVFLKIVLPLLSPAIVAGWLMAFTLSFDDFLISFFTSGSDLSPLPVVLYGYVKFGVNNQIYALSSLLLIVSCATVFVAYRLRRFMSLHPR
jgi:spermidine/putrescine transport system permease protein